MASGKIHRAKTYIQQNLQFIIRFVKSSDFYKGTVLTLAILIVLISSLQFGKLGMGISLTMGMFISAPANVPGSNRHRLYGILSAIFLGMLATLTINFSAFSYWVLVPVLGTLIFLISLISVYGFRASLVSFSGLLAIILSFAHPQAGLDIFSHAGLIGLGGLWYLLFAYISNLLAHKSHTLQQMAETMELTAEYLKIQGVLAFEQGKKQEIQTKLFELQTEINEKHETLREILLSSRRRSGQSNFSRRQVLVLIELVDILELAIGNLPNLHKIFKSFANQPLILTPFNELIVEMVGQLNYLSKTIVTKQPLLYNDRIKVLLQQTEIMILEYKKEAESPASKERVLLLQNTYDYFQKQAQTTEVILNLMANLLEKDQKWISHKESVQFISQQDYDGKTLTENLSFKSPIFRHSLRLTITVLAGFAFGFLFSLQNSYWILLTIIVIMRPGYTLTKQRSNHRLYGTLVGGAIAFGIVMITQNTYIYAALAVITFILAFSLVQKNYRSSAIFITLNIVFVYALLKPDAIFVIQYRILDTLTGVALAFIANTFFWPFWEFLNIQEFIGRSIQANQRYLKEVDLYYHHKDNKDPSYKLSRKEAFLAIGNLSAAFQRMTQEPRARQKDLSKIHELVVLNHTFLSLAASLGTYIRHHNTTEASSHFENYVSIINEKLDLSWKVLYQKEITEEPSTVKIQEAQNYLDHKYRQLAAQEPHKNFKEELRVNPELQEVKLISDQLKWLYTISENLIKTIQSL